MLLAIVDIRLCKSLDDMEEVSVFESNDERVSVREEDVSVEDVSFPNKEDRVLSLLALSSSDVITRELNSPSLNCDNNFWLLPLFNISDN